MNTDKLPKPATVVEGHADMNTDKLTAAEAVFGFAAWLTTKDGDTLMGRSHDSAPIAELCQEFVKANGLSEPREDWHHGLVHPPGKTE
jgi:hypothetical protein